MPLVCLVEFLTKAILGKNLISSNEMVGYS
jgi:hypothetical protein